MDKEHILRILFPILVVFVVAFFKFNRKAADSSTVYFIKQNDAHPLRNFYVMLFASILVAVVALVLLNLDIFSGATGTIVISVSLLVLQLAIFFGYLYKKYNKR